MANIRKYQLRRISIVGGSVQPVEIRQNGINVLRFINWGAYDLKVSQAADPDTNPVAIVSGNGATNNLMNPGGISRIYCYAAGDVDFALIEIEAEDPTLILAMESVVANLMTSLPAGTAHVGSMGIDVGSTPVSASNPVPVAGDVTLTGSNVEGTPGSAAPSKAVLVGGSDGSGNLRSPAVDIWGNSDGTSASYRGMLTGAEMMGHNGSTWDRVRVANVFKHVAVPSLASAAATTVWAPAAGKKIRLMGVVVAASIAGIHQLRMGVAGSGNVIATAYLQAGTSLFIPFGQGKLAAVVNDVLELYNNNGVTGVFYITAYGTEE